MNMNRTIITGIFAIGLAAAVQTTSAGELPDSVEAFAEAQQQQILIQGYEAQGAIAWTLKHEFAEQRVAFIESQLRGIEAQGERALASIREDLGLRAPEGMVAGTRPIGTEAHDWPAIAASAR